MLSALSQGYGTWDGLTNVTGPESLPSLAMLSEHKHGVTVKSARRRKPQIVRVEEIDGSIHMPKTYLTRKGALVLYSSEQSVEDTKQPRKPIDVEKVIERLGNVRRLMASILYLNDSQVDDTDISVSDERNKVYMGFLRSVDNVLYKQRIQPGQDLKFYLNTLQLRARKLMELAGSDIARQISELLCTPVLSSRPSTSGTSATRKLSSAKLTASLKSDSYMGRKVLYPALDTSLHEMLNTPFSTSTWPLSQRHAIPNLHDSKIEEIDTESSDQRTHSAGHVSEKRHKGRLNSAISTNSGSMVEDLTLFEEVDISLPSDNGAPEPDSDIENEYFNTVLNYDELPKDELREASGKDRRDIAANSSIERHLTNTPDMESSFMDAEVKSGSIMTPDITLRSGHSGTFNILNSQISKHDDGSLVNTHVQQSSPQLSHGKRLGSSQDSSKEDTSLLVNQSQVMPESSDPAGSKSNQNSRSSSQHLSHFLEDAEASKTAVDSSLSEKKEPSKQQQTESRASQLDERITLQSVPHSPTNLTDRTQSSTSSKGKEHTLPTVNNTDDDTSQKVEIPDSQFTEGRENLQLPLYDESHHSTTASPTELSARFPTPSEPQECVKSDNVCSDYDRLQTTPHIAIAPTPELSASPLFIKELNTVSLKHKASSSTTPSISTADKNAAPLTPQANHKTKTVKHKIRGASGKPSSIRSPVSAGSKGRSAKSSPLISASSKADPQVNVTPILSEPPPPKTKPEITYRLPPPNTIQTQPKVPTVPKINKIRDADKEALKRAEKMQKDEQKALEALMRDPDEVKEIMTSNMAEEFDETGLSLEELELAREMLNQRMAEAEKGIEQNLTARSASEKSDKSKSKLSKSTDGLNDEDSKAKRRELMEKRDQIRQAKRLEQQKRTAEKKALQEMILVKTKEERAFLAEEERRIKEIMEKERQMNAIAEEARQQEEEARKALAESRRLAKIEREQKRKDELERRKEEAIRRYLAGMHPVTKGREEQRRMQDAARQKELDMLEKISDAETVRNLREKERKRKEEEEWKLQAKIMEDERLSGLRAEDEELRIATIEREAEESAMARLIDERMEAERRERELEQERRLLQAREEERKAYAENEKRRIEEALLMKEEEERKEQEAERERILELKRLEIEAQELMKKEMEERRAELLMVRELNMNKKHNLETIKKNQALTKPWVFSYYVKWPRETYERMMAGAGDKRRRPMPRQKKS